LHIQGPGFDSQYHTYTYTQNKKERKEEREAKKRTTYRMEKNICNHNIYDNDLLSII
jgi:hypothetical protein